jgi:hypothetical protein
VVNEGEVPISYSTAGDSFIEGYPYASKNKTRQKQNKTKPKPRNIANY